MKMTSMSRILRFQFETSKNDLPEIPTLIKYISLFALAIWDLLQMSWNGSLISPRQGKNGRSLFSRNRKMSQELGEICTTPNNHMDHFPFNRFQGMRIP
jgi:hypothetical protein